MMDHLWRLKVMSRARESGTKSSTTSLSIKYPYTFANHHTLQDRRQTMAPRWCNGYGIARRAVYEWNKNDLVQVT